MKNQASARRHTQSGSIFFWIFFMVFLFAALSFALTTGFRSGGSSVTADKAKLAATEIMDYGRIMRDAVKAMRINGIPIENLDFRSNTLTLQNGTPYLLENDNCTDDNCQVFSRNGGGINAVQFYEYGYAPSWWQSTWNRVGSVEVGLAKMEGIGSALSDVVFRVTGVQVEICKAFNKLYGIDRYPISEDYTGETYYPYDGDMSAALLETDNYHLGQDIPEFRNKIGVCNGNADNGEIFLLILAR